MVAAQTAEIVISEIRIDQPSTDNDEYFELAGTPGAALDGLTYLVIGDGTGGSGVIENVTDLNGQAIGGSGFFVAAESTFTLGTADLTTDLNFENSDNVTHLLVAGFSGSDGDDLDTDDDGVLDVTPWSELVDVIALVEEENPPSGTEYHYGPPSVGPDGSFVPGHAFVCDSGWQVGAFDTAGGSDTPGAPNNCSVASVPELVINEIDYDQPSTDAAEFVEIKNVGAEAVSLNGVTLELVNGTGGGAAVYETFALPDVMLAVGDYFVVCGDAGNTANCDLDVTPDTNLIQNGAPDAVGLRFDGELLDAVSYEGDTGAPYTEGSGANLEDIAVDDAIMSISRCEDGTDTNQNNVDFVFTTSTPGATNDCDGGEPPMDTILLTELVVTPTGGEFIEIHNPTADAIDLSDFYVTDATFVGGGTYYYNIVTGSNAGGGGFADFHARFPAGATIPAGAYQTIALAGSSAFTSEYGIAPDYELFDDGSNDGEQQMREALLGSINGQGGLTNDGEVAILYYWDGQSDLVFDVDYAVWGDKAEAVDKTGVSIDGPDGDTNTTSYQPDTSIASQDVIDPGAHASGESWQREDLDEGAEIATGGNGLFGNNETSEDLSNTWCSGSPTPGAATECSEPGGTIGACFDPATFIHEVQGNGLASPLNGQTVVVEGVVVGDFQNIGAADADNGDLNGFHLQEEDGQADADPASSEGVFIYAPGITTDVINGDVVRVLGAVSEFNGMTEITASEIAVCGSGAAVTPATVTLPVASIDDLEAYEGMSVTFPQALVISEYFNFDRFGEIVLTTDRQFQPTAVHEPGSPEAAALADLNRRSRIMLDDGRTNQNPDPAIHPNGAEFTLDNLFRGGDTVANVIGVLDYSFGLYRVQPTAGADYTAVNLRPELPEDVGGDIQVASFNVLNYFTTIDPETGEIGWICGPNGDQECRGADSQEELDRQRAKIVAAIADMDAEVVGLIEIQNDQGESTADLVQALNTFLGDDVYAYINTGYIGTDAIKQAFIYQPGEVTPVGDYAVLESDAFVDPMETGEGKNRPALAQTFMDNDGGVVTVVVNHLKSKGSGCGPGDDDPEQGNCNLTRTLAAQELAGWLATDPTGSGDADFLIIGDLNAYDKEDPIDALTASGYADLVAQYGDEFAYSYVFDGQLGYLDHGLANANLAPQVTGATVWHINADEADLIDYDTSFKEDEQDAIYAPDEFRSSDHDPVIVGLDLNGSPNCSGAVPSAFSLWPPNHQFYSIDVLGVTDPEGDPITITIDGIFQDEAVDADESGNTAPDGMGVGTSTAQVRAERVGTGGNGRVYHIFFTATDDQGGSCSGEVLVSVPVGRHMMAIDDGALFDSTVVPE